MTVDEIANDYIEFHNASLDKLSERDKALIRLVVNHTLILELEDEIKKGRC